MRLRTSTLLPLATALILGPLATNPTGGVGAADAQATARDELGRRLFADARLSSPRGDFDTACASCHLLDQDPQGLRAYTDFLARPWFPWRSEDPRREHPRNAPTLLGVAAMPVLHLDGEYRTLEALVRGTLTGRPMGWLPQEEDEAERHLMNVVAADPTYRRLLRDAFAVAPSEVAAGELTARLAEAVALHLRALRSPRRSPYDRFVEGNGLPATPAAGESPADYGARVVAELDRLESRGALALPPGFDEDALAGLRFFLRTGAEAPSGNCVSCHPPPAFTDHAFHNVGASQDEYDALHGPGAFAALALPPPGTRPVERLRRAPRRGHPEEADLGHWNHAAARSPSELEGDINGDLERYVAAFKTPTLRNLAYSNPYLHNGRFSTLEDTLAAKLSWAAMARRGELRAADPALQAMRLGDEHVRSLVAFLATLGEELVPGRSVPPLPRPAREGDRRDNYPRD